MPTFTVVVCTRNRPQLLDRCLASLSRLDYSAFDVLVVDNAPQDDRSRDVASRWGTRYVVEPSPGLSRARNLGARSSEAEIVAYVDDDAIAEPGWLAALAPEFQDPMVAVVTGSILPLSSETTVGAESFAPATRWQRRVVDRATPGWFEISNFGEIGDGSNMAFRRSVFEGWLGFHEKLGRGTILNGGEEHYAFFNLIEGGHRIVYNPAAVVRHAFPRDPRETRSRHLRLLSIASAYITRLAVEHPSYRKTIAQFALDRVRGRGRRANHAEKSPDEYAGRIMSLLALLRGPWIYFRSRRAPVPAAPEVDPPESFVNHPASKHNFADRHFTG